MKHAALALILAASAAQADVVAIATNENIRLELHDTAGPCQGRALWAVITDGKRTVSGCWAPKPPAEIAVAWLDGDYTVFPISVFREPEKL
jgi:uncharacterized protein YraI